MRWSNCHTSVMLSVSVILSGCGPKASDHSSDGRLPVFAGIPQVAYLVEQIGGSHVKVDALLQPGQDPHTFEPQPRQVLALGRAVVFFKIDMPFENLLIRKVQEGNAKISVVDVTRGIAKRSVDATCSESHSDGGHDHPEIAGEPDPHVWLSPPLLKALASNIATTLCKLDVRHKAEYQKNLAALDERMDAVNARIASKLAPFRGRSFYVFHPGFGYFADAYGLKQQAVETGGRTPTPQQFRALIEKARADGATAMFIQPQYDPKSAQAVADALDARVCVIDGLRQDPVADIEDIAEKLESALKK
jgi:zinc transport system substrate-binding protein